MLPLKFNDALHFSDLCCRLIEFHSSMMLVAVIDKKGRILEMQRKEEFSCLDEKDIEMLFMQRALQTTMITESDDKLGVFVCTITKREKFFEYTMKVGEEMLLMIIDSAFSFSETIRVIDELNQRLFVDFKSVRALAA